MAAARYNPKARSTRDPRAGTDLYVNHDGPIRPGGDPRGDTINYGPHKPRAQTDFGSPRWSDRDPSFDYTPEMLAQEAAARQPYIDRRNELLGGDQGYQQAQQAGDLKGMIAAMTRLKQAGQQQRFIDQGGTADTWNNRFSNENNWPRPTSAIGYSHGPGRPDYATVGTNPSPYGPGNTAPPVRHGATPAGPQAAGPVAVPPMQNPMMQGYLGGGAGVSSGPGGWGPAAGPMPGGFNPEGPYGGVMSPEAMAYRAGQSKSGMGQSFDPRSMVGTGTFYGDTTPYGSPMGGYNPNAAAGLNDYLSSMMSNFRMSPSVRQGFAGMSPYAMDPGMMMFGYQPMY